jgi:hypothetical protein
MVALCTCFLHWRPMLFYPSRDLICTAREHTAAAHMSTACHTSALPASPSTPQAEEQVPAIVLLLGVWGLLLHCAPPLGPHGVGWRRALQVAAVCRGEGHTREEEPRHHHRLSSRNHSFALGFRRRRYRIAAGCAVAADAEAAGRWLHRSARTFAMSDRKVTEAFLWRAGLDTVDTSAARLKLPNLLKRRSSQTAVNTRRSRRTCEALVTSTERRSNCNCATLSKYGSE